MNWDMLRLFFYLGAVLNAVGVIFLFIGASLLSFAVPCPITGCPSTTPYWEETFTGIALVLLGSGMMIFSTVKMRGQLNRPQADASKKRILTSFKITLLSHAIVGLSMLVLGFVFTIVSVGVTYQCSSTLPCWPPAAPGEPQILFLLGVFLTGFSQLIWRLIGRISCVGTASGQKETV